MLEINKNNVMNWLKFMVKVQDLKESKKEALTDFICCTDKRLVNKIINKYY